VERIVLYALDSPSKLTSFRTARLEGWVVKQLDQMKQEASTKTQGENEDDMADDSDLISTTPAHAAGTDAFAKVCVEAQVPPLQQITQHPVL
jgi:hypothetical protein